MPASPPPFSLTRRRRARGWLGRRLGDLANLGAIVVGALAAIALLAGLAWGFVAVIDVVGHERVDARVQPAPLTDTQAAEQASRVVRLALARWTVGDERACSLFTATGRQAAFGSQCRRILVTYRNDPWPPWQVRRLVAQHRPVRADIRIWRDRRGVANAATVRRHGRREGFGLVRLGDGQWRIADRFYSRTSGRT